MRIAHIISVEINHDLLNCYSVTPYSNLDSCLFNPSERDRISGYVDTFQFELLAVVATLLDAQRHPALVAIPLSFRRGGNSDTLVMEPLYFALVVIASDHV